MYLCDLKCYFMQGQNTKTMEQKNERLVNIKNPDVKCSHIILESKCNDQTETPKNNEKDHNNISSVLLNSHIKNLKT